MTTENMKRKAKQNQTSFMLYNNNINNNRTIVW